MYSWIREWFGRSPVPGGAPPIVTGGVVEDGAAREETDVKNGVEEVCLQQCPENDWEKRNTALLLTSITLFTILVCRSFLLKKKRRAIFDFWTLFYSTFLDLCYHWYIFLLVGTQTPCIDC